MSNPKERSVRAEIIAIGDELTSGQRLDTNSRWISQQLNVLGIPVAFHSTVGDSHADNLKVFSNAMQRADLVVCTGGLGPTADDLTRQVLAEVSGCELKLDPPSLKYIQQLFERRGRQMPESNRIQAFFPAGANVIENPHGSAPGIAMSVSIDGQQSLVIALPGVPAELREMWALSVESRIKETFKVSSQIFHHTVHCFGKGESEIESLIPELISRNRDPLVGITASQATISLRIQAKTENQIEFEKLIEPTLTEINDKLADLIYGTDGATLQENVNNQLNSRNQTIGLVDVGHHGCVGNWLSQVPNSESCFAGSSTLQIGSTSNALLDGLDLKNHPKHAIEQLARRAIEQMGSDIGLAYQSQTLKDGSNKGDFEISLAIVDKNGATLSSFSGSSHPAIREHRVGKWVLNELRIWLQNRPVV